jgi:DNA polymerase-3 subunit gamma/tau
MASLYRKHRPRTFADVVGQEHIVRTLQAAVEQDRVAHAYLFAGPRGTGKTSLAKILAKALNCEHGPTPTPDGTCERCMAIHEARSLDVIELDAASNRGIDTIRETVIERASLAPIEGGRKIYILDEAHSLTADASNALLKTLEEPPEKVVFILCTTDAGKLLPTVRSRCQRFAFRRPGPGELATVLRRIADAEQIEAADAAPGVRPFARVAGERARRARGALPFGGSATIELMRLRRCQPGYGFRCSGRARGSSSPSRRAGRTAGAAPSMQRATSGPSRPATAARAWPGRGGRDASRRARSCR